MQLRKALLWICWLFLLLTWLDTLLHLWQTGQTRPILLAVLAFASLWLLYFAEGLELAVAARVGVADPPVADPHEFFTRRQAIVILTITFITLATAYPWIEVPWFGRLSGIIPFWFSLVFDSLTILWFVQVLPKRLAVLDPDEFLGSRHTRWFLRVVKFVGSIFDGPSDDLVRFKCRRRLKRAFTLSNLPECNCLICRPAIAHGWAVSSVQCSCSICRG